MGIRVVWVGVWIAVELSFQLINEQRTRAEVLLPVQGDNAISDELITPPHVEAPLTKDQRPLALKLGWMLWGSCHSRSCRFNDWSLPLLAMAIGCDVQSLSCRRNLARRQDVDTITHGVLKQDRRIKLVLRRYHLSSPEQEREVEEMVPDELSDILLNEWMAHVVRRLEGAREGILVVKIADRAPDDPRAVRIVLRNLGDQEVRFDAPGALTYLPEGTYALNLEIEGQPLPQGTIRIIDGQRIDLGTSIPPPFPAPPGPLERPAAPAAQRLELELGTSLRFSDALASRDLFLGARFNSDQLVCGASFSAELLGGGIGTRLDAALNLGLGGRLTGRAVGAATLGVAFASLPDGGEALLLPVEVRLDFPGRLQPILYARALLGGRRPQDNPLLSLETYELGFEIKRFAREDHRNSGGSVLRLSFRETTLCESARCERPTKERFLGVSASYIFGASW